MRAFIALVAAMGFGLIIIIFGSMYTVNEGHVAVITEWGKAIRQEKPAGLQFKMPIITGVEEFDARERIIEGSLSAATSNQLATAVSYTANWRPDPEQILFIFINYGSPDEFANNVIKTRLNQSLKSVIGKFSGAQLIREREAVAEAMLLAAKETLERYPAFIESVQIENFELPARYMEAILQTEEQRATTSKENLILEQQAIKSRGAVQTAEATRDARKAQADGEAYAATTKAQAESDSILIKTEAEANRVKALAQAEAEKLRMIGEARAYGFRELTEAVGGGDLAVEISKNIAWDGKLPVTVLGDSPQMLMQMPN